MLQNIYIGYKTNHVLLNSLFLKESWVLLYFFKIDRSTKSAAWFMKDHVTLPSPELNTFLKYVQLENKVF